MSENPQHILEGYSAPAAVAESMLKRYNQFKAAFPTDDLDRLHHFILENRYKLLGIQISQSDRRKAVDLAKGSLELLTMHTILLEHPLVVGHFKQDQQNYNKALSEIYKAIHSGNVNEAALNDLIAIGWKAIQKEF